MDWQLLAACLVFLFFLLVLVCIKLYRIKGKVLILQQQTEILMEISKDLIYEYHLDSRELIPSEQLKILLGEGGEYQRAAGALINSFVFQNDTCQTLEILLTLPGGKTQRFKSINSSVLNRHGNLEKIIGKLVPAEQSNQE